MSAQDADELPPCPGMVSLVDRDDCRFYHCDWRALAATVGRVDTLIVDAPYSERTHAGHDSAAASKNEERSFDGFRSIAYSAWSTQEVAAFVAAWGPIADGWFVTITDHMLAPAWADSLAASGRYVFSPLACVEPGSRVRVVGDGPSQWSCFAVVARPRSPAFVKWGTLPGAYVTPPGQARARSGAVVGGKGLWLMERLVEDYSRPGDLVCDPCAGAGTTGLAALRTGRRFVGCDAMRKHADIAAEALSRPQQQPLFAAGGGQ